jgi:hypothetical protein
LAGTPVFCSIVNAAADGKRLRAIDATADLTRAPDPAENRLARQKRR